MPRYALRLASIVTPVVSGLGAIPIFNECSISVDISTMAERLSRIRQSKQHKFHTVHAPRHSKHVANTYTACSSCLNWQAAPAQPERQMVQSSCAQANNACRHAHSLHAEADETGEACCLPCSALLGQRPRSMLLPGLSSECPMPGKGTFGIVGACREIGCRYLSLNCLHCCLGSIWDTTSIRKTSWLRFPECPRPLVGRTPRQAWSNTLSLHLCLREVKRAPLPC